MIKQEQSEKIVYGSLITSTKCYNCIHFPLCFAQKGGANLELASENDCCYYQSKLPENSVVLSREEYEKLKQYEEKVENGACFTQKEWLELCDEEYKRETENLSKVRQLERKETAREILNELIDSSNKITFFDCRMALGLDKLAKQFGLEIKE